MAKKNKKKKRFGGAFNKVESSKERGGGFGYLKLQGASLFKPSPKQKIVMNMLCYIVTDPNHADKIEEDNFACVGEPWWKRPFRVHRDVGPDNEKVICLKVFGKKCPICEEQDKLRKKDGDHFDEIKALYPQDRTLYVLKPTSGHGDMEEKPYVWDQSDYKFLKPLKEEVADDEEFEDFFDPAGEHSVKVKFKQGTFGQFKFADVSGVDIVEREEEIDEGEYKKMPNLDEMLKELTYDEVKNKYFGMEDEVEATSGKRKKKGEKAPKEDKKKDKKKGKKKKEGKQPTTLELVQECDTVEDLIDVVNEYPSTFDKKTVKKLKKIEKLKKLKVAIIEVIEKSSTPNEDDLPFNKTASSKKEGKDEGKKCPSGYKFGKDTDKFEECSDCELWKKCKKAKK